MIVRKINAALVAIFTLGLSTILALSNSSISASAQAPTPTPTNAPFDPVIIIEITGVVASVTPDLIVLSDGTTVRLGGIALPPDLQPGVTIQLRARFEGDDLILIEFVLLVATPTPTLSITLTPTSTLVPTATTTAEPTAEATLEVNCPEALNGHPVGYRLAATFDVTYEEIMYWKCSGFGFGEITKAYVYAADSGLPVADIFAMKAGGMGWGNIRKQITDTGDDEVITISLKDNPGKGKDKGGVAAGKDNGNGKGNGNGNGKANDKGKGPKK